jgi:hypothetical protein
MPQSFKRIALLAVLIACLSWAGCGSTPSGSHHVRSETEVTLGDTIPKSRVSRPPRAAVPPPRTARLAVHRPPTGVQPPPIRQWRIPFPASRKQEMAAYSGRHYGRATYRLVDPQVIVEHYNGDLDGQRGLQHVRRGQAGSRAS